MDENSKIFLQDDAPVCVPQTVNNCALHTLLRLLIWQGNRLMPQCGFSGTMVNILQSLSVPFETVDVLSDDRIRQGIKVTTETVSDKYTV